MHVTADGMASDTHRLAALLDELTRGIVLERRHLYATCHVFSDGEVSLRVQDAQSGRIRERRMGVAWPLETEEAHRLYAQALKLAVRLAPDEVYLVRALGDHYLAFRRYDEGIACFEALIEEHPQSPLLPFQLGLAYERSRRKEEAQRAFQRAYALDPEDPVTMYNLGVAASDLGRPRDATCWFRKALSRDPGLSEARVRLDGLREAAKANPPR